MCTFVTVERGPDTFDCVSHGELTEALGGEPVYRQAARESRTAEDCLCQFDAEATAQKYGYIYDPAYSSFGDITLRQVEPVPG
jgi:hypothetical protein